MDALTLLSDMTQVQEREALHLRVQFPSEKVAREVFFVGECARSGIGLEIATQLLGRASSVTVSRVAYATDLFGSHECVVCKRPHGFGPYSKYRLVSCA